MNSANLVNASIVTYVSFTFLFFVLKYRFFPNTGQIWILGFLAISCLLQLGQNIHLTTLPALCGKMDVKMALYSTLIPWLVIFSVFSLLLTVAPGWLRIFSNTFGVAAAEAYGLKETLQQIFAVKPTQSDIDPKMMQLIDQIYSDKMSLVNELNLDDVTENPFRFPAMEKLVAMRVVDPSVLSEDKKTILQQLYRTLQLKDTVGYFFWFLLIGIFCILVSTLSLLSSSCTPAIGSAYDSIFTS
jgi:hypothetical protein